MSGVLGKYKIAADLGVLADGDSIAAYLVDAAGSLLSSTLIGGKQRLDVNTASEFAEDSAHVSGDFGTQVLAVRNDTEGSLVGANGDYAPLQVDALGRLRVQADLSVNNDFVYAEDSAAASGDLGASVLLVRQDTLAASTSADGDYGAFKSNNLGELYVFDTATHTGLTTINSSIQAITHLEDALAGSGDAGVMALAVRNDANATLTSGDGDYSAIAVDSAGRVKITGTIVTSGAFAEDSAHTTGDIGIFSLAVRRDADTSLVDTTGDYAPIQVSSTGDVKVVDRLNVTNLQQVRNVGTTATLLPATALAGRKHIMIQNSGARKIWIGSATVTASGATLGVEIPVNGFWEGDVGPANLLYGITNTGSSDVVVWELS